MTSTTFRQSSGATWERAEIVPQAEEIVEEIRRFARWLGQFETLPR